MRLLSLMRHTATAAVIAITAGVMVAPSTVNAKTLRWAYQGDVGSLDPMALNETFTLGFQNWFYEALTTYDKDLNLVPALAEKWENPEPTKWIFHLRQGVTFHDGTPFTAED